MQAVDREIGQRLRQLRWRSGLSQKELGASVGVSFQQVQKYETGKNRLALPTALGFCAALRCSINDIVDSPDVQRGLSEGAVNVATIYDTLPMEKRRLIGRLVRAL